jgi:DNA polymerase-4
VSGAGRPPDGTLGFIHVDMDAFFASVELRRRPELRGQPVVVGGTGERGVVAAASYEARVFGIHSAMPSTQARRLCPHVVFLPGDHGHYSDVSREVMAILHDATPLVEPLSLDEAFLDVRGALHGEDRAAEIGLSIRQQVFDELQLTCSVGVATNKFLAKLATERAKPKPSPKGPQFGSGVFVVEPGTELDFLHPMPVRELWGVGPATGRRLSSMGIETVGDLASQPRHRLEASVGKAAGMHLHALSNAKDERPVETDQALKSIGHEETFAKDLVTHADLRPHLMRMADAVAARLRAGAVLGRTVTIKVRFSDFTTITRSITVHEPLDGARAIAIEAEQMLEKLNATPGVRLLGVSLSQLVDGSVRQLTLDEVIGPAWSDADSVVDEIRERFGSSAIGPAASARPGEGIKRFEVGQQQWGPDQR